MPADYGLDACPASAQRRRELVMDAATRELLQRAQLGHIATLWHDQPFINPTTFWYDAERHEVALHSNVVGRVRANAEHPPRACFEASEVGRLLPSNVALEFSLQFESVIAHGAIRVLDDPAEKRRALTGLIGKYFPSLAAARECRPMTDQELKRNWHERAEQSGGWAPLGEELFR